MSWRRSLGLCLLVLTAAGCGAAGRASVPVESAPETASVATAGPETGDALGAQESSALQAIRLAQGKGPDGSVRVEIEASAAVNYTSYEPDSRTFILEIPNVDVSALPGTLPIGESGILRAVVSALPSSHGRTHAKIEFAADTSMKAVVVPEGRVIAVLLTPEPEAAILVAGDAAPAVPGSPADMAPSAARTEAPAAAPAAPAPTVQQARALPEADASVVSGVVVEGTGPGASVAIIGDGGFRHNTFVLKNPDRLVVDLVGVTNRVPEKVFDVNADPVRRIRVAQFKTQPEKVVRVVFDLSAETPHRVVDDADGLRVVLGDGAAVAAEPVVAAATPAPDAGSAETVLEPARSFAEPAPAKPRETVADAAPRLVPASASDLGKDLVLFDRADPGQDTGEMGTLIPPGTTFQSQTIAGERRRYRGEKISITFRDADIREVFFFFADVMKMNIVLDPEVAGRIDIRLTQVPWDQAFHVILKNQGLDAIEEDSVIRIAKTQKLRQEASERRALKQAQEQELDPVMFTRQLSYAKAQDAMTIVNQIKSDRGKVMADIRSNMLIISDVPDKRQAYENLLTALDAQTPQVSIEARIVEAIRSFERSLGIDWNFTGLATPALGTQTNLDFPHRAEFEADVNLGSTSQAGTLGIALGNVLDSVTLDVTLDAFEADGKVRILSSPKVVTQNNQPATIEQGVQIPVVTTTATEIEVQYVPASLRLIVTPQITAEQTVIMKVMVENNQPSTTVSVGDTPGIVTERVDTQILVRSGSTAVIGGVYKLQESDTETGIPGLRRIPFFGWLFKNKSIEKNSSELIVFLTPKIVTNI